MAVLYYKGIIDMIVANLCYCPHIMLRDLLTQKCMQKIDQCVVHLQDSCVVHLQDKVTPSTKALWHGASFQNRSY
jgi:hypothetical protein